VTNIWYSSAFLYLGDTMLVSALLGGTIAMVAVAVKRSRSIVFLDVSSDQLRKFAYFQILWMMSALILFKFVVLQGGLHIHKSVLTGAHGSVQFSTAGELVAFLLAGYGLYRWAHWLAHHLKLVDA